MAMGVEQDRLIEPVFLPLMTIPQPDTSLRKKQEMQGIPWALPPVKEKPPLNEHSDSDLAARRRD